MVTALTRHFSNRGLRVAPFKSQNMSNNARVVRGGEIGVAQYLQALAARAEPDVRMNPVLIKPEVGGSQSVIMGSPDPELSVLPWRMRKAPVWPEVREALHDLMAEYDLVVIEGAGSPAEIYLKDNDIANMMVAREARAPVILVADIFRGGAFAHLYGTWALLPEEERALIRGFILNMSVGNASLLDPGLKMLKALTGVPTIGMVPLISHVLPEEDAYVLDSKSKDGAFTVAIVRYPRISNFDEFKPLETLPDVRLVWAERAEEVEAASLVVLPGSKHVMADLTWMRARGFEGALRRHVAEGKPLIGICGGLQMLGESLDDPLGIEGDGAGGEALGFLPLRTRFEAEKVQRETADRFERLTGYWQPLSGLEIRGYEIRHGRSYPTDPAAAVTRAGLGFAANNVLGVYMHGLFENDEATEALFGANARARDTLEASFEQMARTVAEHVDLGYIDNLLDLGV